MMDRAHSVFDTHDVAYDLPDHERDRLTRQLLSGRPVSSDGRLVCVAIEGTDPFANIARQIEREVFEASWGNDPATMLREYGPYDRSSMFFLVVDAAAQVPAAAFRMIRNSPAGLKTIVDLDDEVKSPIAPRTLTAAQVMRRHGIDDLDHCWDGATAAVPRRYRRKLSAMHVDVMRVMAMAATREGIEHFVAVLDAPVVRAARDLLGLPLAPLADTPPFTHMDAPHNQAVYAHLPTLLSTAMVRNRRMGDKIRGCFEGTGANHLNPLPSR